jgi:hypothetical protein
MRNLPIKSKACQLSLPFGVQYRPARDAEGILQKVLIILLLSTGNQPPIG